MISEDAPAKVNLALHVTGRRADGYHLLDTLVVFCEAGDRITFEPAAKDRFTVGGRFGAALGPDGDNLVIRARDMLRTALQSQGCEAPPLAIHLEKRLPVAAGIGGGSADAAAVLRGLSRLWEADPGVTGRLAPRLGADVPMCLDPRPLVARGIGEEILPLAPFPALDLVLVNPGLAVSTPAVFGGLAEKRNPPMGPLPAFAGTAAALDFIRGQRNDLEAPARTLAPAIGDVLAALAEAGAVLARMSGSGATCFGVWNGGESATRAAAALHRRFPQWYVQATRTHPAKDEDDEA